MARLKVKAEVIVSILGLDPDSVQIDEIEFDPDEGILLLHLSGPKMEQGGACEVVGCTEGHHCEGEDWVRTELKTFSLS